jgi:hypothetical protein
LSHCAWKPGKAIGDGLETLADRYRPGGHHHEVRYIQRRAADHDSRILTIGQLVLFSTDAWLPRPHRSVRRRLARDGQSEPIHIEETDTTFAIGWKGRYRIDGPAFVYSRSPLASRPISSARSLDRKISFG